MNTQELELIYTQLAQALGQVGEARTPLMLSTLSLDLLSQLSFETAQQAINTAQALAQA